MMIELKINVAQQKLFLLRDQKIICDYIISTAKNGLGEKQNSHCTPRGLHIVRAKIGANLPIHSVFVARRPTGEIFSPHLLQKNPERDFILTRIIWLSGLEVGKNRLGEVDTMRRFIYIHGTPYENKLGSPESKGCIRMGNVAVVELFAQVPIGTKVMIE